MEHNNKKGLLIDLHVHTDLSNDGRVTLYEQAESAAANGLDAIVLTDHDACSLDAPVRHGDVWLLPGCEISTQAGHILGLFLDRKPDIGALHKNGLPSASDAVASLHECGAVTVLAHPYTKKDARPEAPVDCIECANARAYFKNSDANTQAEMFAKSLDLPGTGGSDAHAAYEVGNAYTIIDAPDCSLPALRDALLNGRCQFVLVKNTPRRYKGYSQFTKAIRSRNPTRIIKGIAYIGYCILLDIIIKG